MLQFYKCLFVVGKPRTILVLYKRGIFTSSFQNIPTLYLYYIKEEFHFISKYSHSLLALDKWGISLHFFLYLLLFTNNIDTHFHFLLHVICSLQWKICQNAWPKKIRNFTSPIHAEGLMHFTGFLNENSCTKLLRNFTLHEWGIPLRILQHLHQNNEQFHFILLNRYEI